MTIRQITCTEFHEYLDQWNKETSHPATAAQWPTRSKELAEDIQRLRYHMAHCDYCVYISLDEPRKQALLDGVNPNLSNGMNLKDIAKTLSLGKTTLINWRSRYENFPEGYLDRSQDESVYLLYDVEKFMEERGLTGRRSTKAPDVLPLDHAFATLCPTLSTEWRLVVLLSASAQAFSISETVTAKHVIDAIVNAHVAIQGEKSRLPIEDMSQEIDGWLDLSGRNDIYLQVSHQNVVAWVRRYMRSTNRNGMIFGSPSLGSLIQHLAGVGPHIVDMTPSAGFLADSFGSASSSLTIFSPTIEAGLIGYFCADVPSTAVVVGDWLSGQFVPPRRQGGTILIGATPTTFTDTQSRSIPSSDDGRRLPGCQKTRDVIDLYVQCLVAATPENGRAFIVVPAKWCSAPQHKAVREALVRGNLIDCVIELPTSLGYGNAASTLIVIDKQRELDKAIKFVTSFEAVGTLSGPRMRDLSNDDCAYIADFVHSDGEVHVGEFEDTPVTVALSRIIQNNSALQRSAYLLRNTINLDLVPRTFQELVGHFGAGMIDFTNHLETCRELSILLNKEVSSTDAPVSVQLISLSHLNSPITVSFVSRKQSEDWNNSYFTEDDVVLNLLGHEAGHCVRASEIEGTDWVRVARLRVTNNNIVLPEYLEMWARFNRTELMRLVPKRTRAILSRDDVMSLHIPCPDMNSQRRAVALANELMKLTDVVLALSEAVQSLESALAEVVIPPRKPE
jgi:hypothetical protein